MSLRRLVPLVVFAGLIAVFWIAGRQAEKQLCPTGVGVDDAGIYFRYAKNLADGLGCVWNPGGERVEGCSSLLWTAVCTAIFFVTQNPEPFAFALGALFAALAATLVALVLARLIDQGGGERGRAATFLAAGAVVALWVVAAPGQIIWMTTALMDTPLWTATIVLSWMAAAAWMREPDSRKNRLALGTSAALAALARPEGPMLAALVIGASVILQLRERRGLAATLKDAATPVAVVALTIAALVVARRLYFGWWLPNTWYAKVDSDLGYRIGHGARYLGTFVKAFPAASAAWVVATLYVLVKARQRPAILASVLVAFGLANALFVAGDHFGYWRILQPYWLLALVPVYAAVARIVPPPRRAIAASLAGIALAAASLATAEPSWSALKKDPKFHASFLLAEAGRLVASSFHEIFPKDELPSVGVVAGGSFPFAYGGQCFDLLGLNDVQMAHASRMRRGTLHGHGAFDAATFFRRPPDLLIGLMRVGELAAPEPPEERIPFGSLLPAEQDRFDALYAPVAIWTEASRKLGAMMPAWARRDWLARAEGRFQIKRIAAR
jgi:hypothetical protein